MELATERLMLRPPRLADVPALFAFLGDAEAMRHSHPYASLRECRRHIALQERCRRRDGCAPWTVIARETGRVIGYGGLHLDPSDRRWGIELSYWFHPESWGQGFASELARAATALADDVLRLPETFGFAHPDNAASRRVLAKAGYVPLRYVPELDRLVFRRPRAGRS